MPYLGTPSLADAHTLTAHVGQKLGTLTRAFRAVRPRWESRDPFGSEVFASDLKKLHARYEAASAHVRAQRADRVGGPGTTAAPRAVERIVRAVRKNGMHGELSDGDLAEMSSRLSGAYRRTGIHVFSDLGGGGASSMFGADLDLHTGEQVNALVSQYQTWMDKLEDDFDAVKDKWNVAVQTGYHDDTPDMFASDLEALKARLAAAAALRSGVEGTVRDLLTYIPFLTAYSGPGIEYAAILKAIQQGGQGTHTRGDYKDLVDRLAAAQRLSNVTVTGQSAARPVLGNAADTFYKDSSGSDSLLGKANTLGRAIVEGGGKKGDPWWTDPFSNPWLQAGVVVVGLGVVGFAIGEIRAVLPSGPK